MKRYETYKDSGIIRVEKIPENWKVVNFRYLIDVLTDFTANGSFGDLAKNVNYLEDGFSRLIRLTDLRASFSNKGVYLNEHSHKYLKKSELFGGEILLANVGAYAGLAWVFENFQNKASLGPNMFLLKFKETLNEKYAYIALTSYYLHSQLLDKATSSAQPKLNKEDVKSCKFILPSLTEQTQIIKYLDYKTGLIDTIIAQKEALIKKLKEQRQAIINEAVTKGLNPDVKLKDSGIAWLGDIPEHWSVVKLKYVLNTTKGYAFKSGLFKGKGIPVVKASDIKNKSVRTTSTCFIEEKVASKYKSVTLKYGDILISTVGSTPDVIKSAVGQIARVPLELNNSLLNQNTVRLEISDDKLMQQSFLFFLIQNNNYRKYLDLHAHGTANQASLKLVDILGYQVALPPIDEQKQIVKIIEENLNRLDKTFDKTQISIDKLKEYRQSLISEAVTGKIDVRDWQATKS
jgi:type I restriction enzyme S subunit